MADLLRDEAERALRDGVIGFATAFNLKGAQMDWRFEPGVEEIAEDMVVRLIALFDQSPIQAMPRMIPWSDPRLREARGEIERNMRWIEARSDKTFQGWLVKVEGRRRARR
jgi:hypothetical protein